MVEVRCASRSDLEALERHLPAFPGLHRLRLTEQDLGGSVYLLAVEEGRPVGHLMLAWEGAPNLPEPQPNCPDIHSVFVCPRHRMRGVATLMLDEAEELCRARGYEELGLAVGIDNVVAWEVYRRAGFSPTGMPVFVEEGRWTDATGVSREWSEVVRYMTKPLHAAVLAA